jgi:hypothetical protein
MPTLKQRTKPDKSTNYKISQFSESCKMHETQKRCMQVAGFWKVPKILNFRAFSVAFDDGSINRKNPAMAGI